MLKTSMLKKLAIVAAAVAVATVGTVGTVAATPGVAHAAGTLTFRLAADAQPAEFADVSGASTDSTAKVLEWTYTGGDNQVWYFEPEGGTDYEIVNKHSNKCLETDGVAGDQLFQAPCTGNLGEIWDYNNSFATWDAAYNIWNPHSNLYMEVYGGSTSRGASIDAWYFDSLYFCGQWVCEPKNQEWLLESA
jgi:hypothetical protein